MEPKIYVILYREDDPRKNTAVKMIQRGLAKPISKKGVKGVPIVLNPYSHAYCGAWLRDYVLKNGIIVIDASWKKLSCEKFIGIRGVHVKLPPLLPGNPINYGKPCMLSSLEAVCAALYITGFLEQYSKLLGLYKWMDTFHELNKALLEEYARASSDYELREKIREYWGCDDPCYKT